MRLIIAFILCTAASAFAQQPAIPTTAPATAPTTRNWLGTVTTREAIIIPSTQPRLDRPMLALSFDVASNALTVTLTNKSKEPIIVDSELIIPLYFTFFDDRDRPIRMETVEGTDPEAGDFAKRFVTVDPGKSIDRTIDLSLSFAVWVSGTVNTVFQEEQRTLPFGREKMRRLPASAKVKRVQVVYAALQPDREAILSYTNKSVDDWKLFVSPATADLRVTDAPATQP